MDLSVDWAWLKKDSELGNLSIETSKTEKQRKKH